MKLKDIRDHFHSRCDWVNPEKTWDQIAVGDPDRDIKTCLVAWTADFPAIRTAVDSGVDLLLIHEPIPGPDGLDKNQPKLDYAREHGLAVLRNHDGWDRWPDAGIPWAWGRFLGLGDKPAVIGGDRYLHLYDIEPVPFGQFVKQVASQTAKIGEPFVEINGDPDKLVSKIGVGTGCGCNIFTYMEMGCDCGILTDDGSSYWHHVQWAEDAGWPVIVVNHATSEEPGMMSLAQYVNDNIDGVTAKHLPQGCRFRLVGAASNV